MHSTHLCHNPSGLFHGHASYRLDLHNNNNIECSARLGFPSSNKFHSFFFAGNRHFKKRALILGSGSCNTHGIRCKASEPVFEVASELVDISGKEHHPPQVPWPASDVSSYGEEEPVAIAGDGSGGGENNGGYGFGGNGNGGGDGDGGDDDDDNVEEDDSEFGSLLNSEEINKQVKARGITLPPDMAEAARTVGIRSVILTQFMDLQGSKWPLGAAIRGSTAFRNRMLADQSFLFKILTEIAIDSGCATIAEVKKRGDDFWDEFELYMADLVVGIVVDVALVSMLAPYVRFGRTAPATGRMAHVSRAIQNLPSSVFEAATPGRKFSVQQRVASYFYKGIQYGAVGFGCGIIGQGIANSIMLLKRKLKKSEEDVPIPPLVKSAALWGVFLAISSNTRYQVVNGLERVVEGSLVAKRLPLVAMAFTIGIRFANNTYGGMQFVDWARWSGVQ